ncbi:hypothetical protein TNCV_4879571 [Trichonephila clavipes]|nr:hypothetical protein TNCV_4879571 [Trichonephila clavipes]
MLRRLVGTTAPGHLIVQFRNEKLVIMASIPITIGCLVWPLIKNDHQARRRFVEGPPKTIAVVPRFSCEFCLAMKCTSGLNGYVNKQKTAAFGVKLIPQVYVETPLHPAKLTVWCALWASGSWVFFKNDEGHNVTVNGDRYRAMITNFFIP